jgi:hypothetical protein
MINGTSLTILNLFEKLFSYIFEVLEEQYPPIYHRCLMHSSLQQTRIWLPPHSRKFDMFKENSNNAKNNEELDAILACSPDKWYYGENAQFRPNAVLFEHIKLAAMVGVFTVIPFIWRACKDGIKFFIVLGVVVGWKSKKTGKLMSDEPSPLIVGVDFGTTSCTVSVEWMGSKLPRLLRFPTHNNAKNNEELDAILACSPDKW